MAVRNRSAVLAVCLLAAGLAMPGAPVLAQSEDAPSEGDAAGVPAGTSVRLGNWRIHHIEDLRLGQPTLDPKTGAIYHPVAITGTSISFYVIGAGEQELWEVPIIWAGTQPTGNRFHRLDYFGILEESGNLYIYSRETE